MNIGPTFLKHTWLGPVCWTRPYDAVVWTHQHIPLLYQGLEISVVARGCNFSRWPQPEPGQEESQLGCAELGPFFRLGHDNEAIIIKNIANMPWLHSSCGCPLLVRCVGILFISVSWTVYIKQEKNYSTPPPFSEKWVTGRDREVEGEAEQERDVGCVLGWLIL